jgi:protein-S-isoprenylcysteine O-methyltransferase Ste14
MRELNKFEKWFLNLMNNKGGAQILVVTGLGFLALFVPVFFIQAVNILIDIPDWPSRLLVIFGMTCVIIALVFLVLAIKMFGKNFFDKK